MNLQDKIKDIKSFRQLKYNWNGYNGEPISDIVIDKALNLIKELKPIPEVFPTGRGSIQFEWGKDSLYLEMEIFEDKIQIFNIANKNTKEISIGDE
ncbi:hypothetical protein ACFHWD_04290 [Clostridium sp. MT-14]|uniref:hypothetical protein n=1 Tax=Clostridium sp. MT-14 TaxID=3348360 RepID=UPI0035F34920